MNKSKLSALCAQAMGYTIIDNLHVKDANGNWVVDGSDYNPLDNANQADDLLEYVARKLNCSWSLIHLAHLGRYDCWLHHSDCGTDTTAETQNLAKILCALRASDKVTDAEIEEALK